MPVAALDGGTPNQLLVKTANGYQWRNPATDAEAQLQPWGCYLLRDNNEYLLPPSAQLTAGVQVMLSKLHAATPILTADCNIICNEQTATQALYNINCAITATFNGKEWEI